MKQRCQAEVPNVITARNTVDPTIVPNTLAALTNGLSTVLVTESQVLLKTCHLLRHADAARSIALLDAIAATLNGCIAVPANFDQACWQVHWIQRLREVKMCTKSPYVRNSIQNVKSESDKNVGVGAMIAYTIKELCKKFRKNSRLTSHSRKLKLTFYTSCQYSHSPKIFVILLKHTDVSEP